jgi:hypothetical protein
MAQVQQKRQKLREKRKPTAKSVSAGGVLSASGVMGGEQGEDDTGFDMDGEEEEQEEDMDDDDFDYIED